MQYRWLIFSFTALVILGCQKDKIDTSSPDYLIPESTSLVIRIDDLEKVRRDMANNDLLKNLKGLGPFKDIVKQTTILELLNAPKPFLMTYSKSTSDSSVTDVAYIVPYADSIFRLDSLSKVSQKKFKLKTKEFLTTTVDSSNYYSQKIGNFVFITPNLDLLKKAGNLKSGRSSFSELMSASKKDKPLSIVFNEGLLNESWVVRDSTEIEFSGQTLLDVDLFQNEIKFNGVTKLGDSINFLMDAFRNTVPKAAEVPNIIPADVHYLKSLCFDSFDVFNANLRALMNTDEDEIPSFLRNTTEAGIILTKNNEQAIILKVIDPELSIETIETFTPVESFRSVPI